VKAFATDELVAAVGLVEIVDGLDEPTYDGGEGDSWVPDLRFSRRAFKCALNRFSMTL